MSRAEAKNRTVEDTERLRGLRIPFVANSGQTDAAVGYYASTFAGTVFITRDGRIVYSLPAAGLASARGESTRIRPLSEQGSLERRTGWSLAETAVGGRVHLRAGKRGPTRASLFIGNDPSRWRSDVATYDEVSLGEVWPGIRFDLRAHTKNVEKLFTLAPSADASQIRLRVAGAQWLRVNESGALEVGTGLGRVTFTPPAAYQEILGKRRSVKVAYELHGRDYGFRVGNHDPTRPLLIDPLVQSTYLGGSGDDVGNAVAIHPTSQDVYVAGAAGSTDFPGTVGGAQTTNGGQSDAFVARLNAALTTLTQATYIGGSASDFGLALAIHPSSGDVYLAGQTLSTNFPGTAGGAQASNGGGNFNDGFVVRFNAALTTLIQATYLGGESSDGGTSIAIHPTSGDVYVAGITASTNFPGTAGGAQTSNGGSNDAFVARLNAALTTLSQATYLGGSDGDIANGIAIHPSGDVYVTGNTSSTNFPGTAGGAQVSNGSLFGASDAFVARLNAALTTLTQATYLGGGNSDFGLALAIHPTSGDVYVTGRTLSANFPGTAGGAQASFGGGNWDAFVARFNAALTALTQSTYLGGSNRDEGRAISIHPTSGDVYVTGSTNSANFPGTAGGVQVSNGGLTDAFVAQISAALNTLIQATYLGGSDSDVGNAIAIHQTSGDVYVAGETLSASFPGTAGGAQTSYEGINDVFVSRLAACPATDGATLGICPTMFYTLTPCRLADTRNFPGPSGGPALSAGAVRTFPIADVCQVPSTAKAVAVNLAVFTPSNDGDLRVYPAGGAAPLASSINFRPGIVRANNAVIPLGASGQISVQCDMPSGTTHFFFDVYGYFQ